MADTESYAAVAVLLESADGLALLAEAESDGTSVARAVLPLFRKQIGPTHCGLATAAAALGHVTARAEFTEQTVVPTGSLDGFPRARVIARVGLALAEVAVLIEHHGARCSVAHASTAKRGVTRRFVDDVVGALGALRPRRAVVLANYSMRVLGDADFDGHYALVVAWHAASERVLVLNPWGPVPHAWVPVDRLVRAMATWDWDAKRERGWAVAEER